MSTARASRSRAARRDQALDALRARRAGAVAELDGVVDELDRCGATPALRRRRDDLAALVDKLDRMLQAAGDACG
jgi:hypothetical protein